MASRVSKAMLDVRILVFRDFYVLVRAYLVWNVLSTSHICWMGQVPQLSQYIPHVD